LSVSCGRAHRHHGPRLPGPRHQGPPPTARTAHLSRKVHVSVTRVFIGRARRGVKPPSGRTRRAGVGTVTMRGPNGARLPRVLQIGASTHGVALPRRVPDRQFDAPEQRVASKLWAPPPGLWKHQATSR
jgi:hypothetical protein